MSGTPRYIDSTTAESAVSVLRSATAYPFGIVVRVNLFTDRAIARPTHRATVLLQRFLNDLVSEDPDLARFVIVPAAEPESDCLLIVDRAVLPRAAARPITQSAPGMWDGIMRPDPPEDPATKVEW
jgi:hypothetical protein